MNIEEKITKLQERCDALKNEFIGACEDCKHFDVDENEYPCLECQNNLGHADRFEPIEEINHPDRYKSGKYECIDVMQDIYGKDAVKYFCIGNAFKYIWRFEKKNGVQDLQKAIWYLNKCVEVMSNEK